MGAAEEGGNDEAEKARSQSPPPKLRRSRSRICKLISGPRQQPRSGRLAIARLPPCSPGCRPDLPCYRRRLAARRAGLPPRPARTPAPKSPADAQLPPPQMQRQTKAWRVQTSHAHRAGSGIRGQGSAGKEAHHPAWRGEHPARWGRRGAQGWLKPPVAPRPRPAPFPPPHPGSPARVPPTQSAAWGPPPASRGEHPARWGRRGAQGWRKPPVAPRPRPAPFPPPHPGSPPGSPPRKVRHGAPPRRRVSLRSALLPARRRGRGPDGLRPRRGYTQSARVTPPKDSPHRVASLCAAARSSSGARA